ncbi:MAG: M23 family metallopeptidase [Prevotellaceae bacterium]|jgi:hypothetical protein|nr:M23 family metallopeptidase [Prevotellaceae bacterium]
MNKQKTSVTKRVKRWRFRYKLFILNESTLEEVFHVKLSRLSVFIYAVLLVIVTFTVISLLILHTPLKYFLPGASDMVLRSELITETVRVDSLAQHLHLQATQMEVMKAIISGNIPIDSVMPTDSVKWETWERFSLDYSEREKAFCETFEQEEKYNLSLISDTHGQKNDGDIFFRPVQGTIQETFDPKKQRYGLVIATAANRPVLSVLKGVVVMTASTVNDGYIIGVQHENGYISIYKRVSQLLKITGSQVNAGESIAIIAPADNNSSTSQLHFELWQHGQAINPANMIIF